MRWFFILALVVVSNHSMAGDHYSGPYSFCADFSRPFTACEPDPDDFAWASALASRLGYPGALERFVRTDLPLVINERTIQGQIYQSVDHPELFYVLTGDVMIHLGDGRIFNPGVGGFSLHGRTRDKTFLVALHYRHQGVPCIPDSPVGYREVLWNAECWNRLEGHFETWCLPRSLTTEDGPWAGSSSNR